ncbi:hypothetical protein [Arthrobacter sp. 35W]|uniref:hypothetical protein n=1 Tax=Arthrobacter sp. 35W TaxID=1132441 RepID=UPI0012DEBCB0|nr:hypothetical protein [Arthrobacter sp. 35W]
MKEVSLLNSTLSKYFVASLATRFRAGHVTAKKSGFRPVRNAGAENDGKAEYSASFQWIGAIPGSVGRSLELRGRNDLGGITFAKNAKRSYFRNN